MFAKNVQILFVFINITCLITQSTARNLRHARSLNSQGASSSEEVQKDESISTSATSFADSNDYKKINSKHPAPKLDRPERTKLEAEIARALAIANMFGVDIVDDGEHNDYNNDVDGKNINDVDDKHNTHIDDDKRSNDSETTKSEDDFARALAIANMFGTGILTLNDDDDSDVENKHGSDVEGQKKSDVYDDKHISDVDGKNNNDAAGKFYSESDVTHNTDVDDNNNSYEDDDDFWQGHSNTDKIATKNFIFPGVNQFLQPLNEKISKISAYLTHPNVGFALPIFRPADLWQKIQDTGNHLLHGANGAIFGLGQIGGHDYPFPYRNLETRLRNDLENTRLGRNLDLLIENFEKVKDDLEERNLEDIEGKLESYQRKSEKYREISNDFKGNSKNYKREVKNYKETLEDSEEISEGSTEKLKDSTEKLDDSVKISVDFEEKSKDSKEKSDDFNEKSEESKKTLEDSKINSEDSKEKSKSDDFDLLQIGRNFPISSLRNRVRSAWENEKESRGINFYEKLFENLRGKSNEGLLELIQSRDLPLSDLETRIKNALENEKESRGLNFLQGKFEGLEAKTKTPALLEQFALPTNLDTRVKKAGQGLNLLEEKLEDVRENSGNPVRNFVILEQMQGRDLPLSNLKTEVKNALENKEQPRGLNFLKEKLEEVRAKSGNPVRDFVILEQIQGRDFALSNLETGVQNVWESGNEARRLNFLKEKLDSYKASFEEKSKSENSTEDYGYYFPFFIGNKEIGEFVKNITQALEN